jgi:transcriptional regulator with XRE-family HTH domain
MILSNIIIIFSHYSEILPVMDFFSHLAITVRQHRKENGWSQQRLADLTGLDRTTISALECNNFNEIGIRKVQRILQVLNHSLAIQSTGLPTLDDMQRLNKEMVDGER